MKRILSLAAGIAGIAGPALAGAPQPHVQVVNPPLFTIAAYDIDYAVSNVNQDPAGMATVDTIVSIGLPSAYKAQCNVEIAWYDWNGALAGISGPFPAVVGQTVEYTSSVNLANPLEYLPFEENIFRSALATGAFPTFEGYARILTDSTACGTGHLRVDAEYATYTQLAGGGQSPTHTKPINVTKPAGLVGY